MLNVFLEESALQILMINYDILPHALAQAISDDLLLRRRCLRLLDTSPLFGAQSHRDTLQIEIQSRSYSPPTSTEKHTSDRPSDSRQATNTFQLPSISSWFRHHMTNALKFNRKIIMAALGHWLDGSRTAAKSPQCLGTFLRGPSTRLSVRLAAAAARSCGSGGSRRESATKLSPDQITKRAPFPS